MLPATYSKRELGARMVKVRRASGGQTVWIWVPVYRRSRFGGVGGGVFLSLRCSLQKPRACGLYTP